MLRSVAYPPFAKSTRRMGHPPWGCVSGRLGHPPRTSRIDHSAYAEAL